MTSRPLRCPIISPASPQRRRWHDGQGSALLRRDRRAGIPALPAPARPLLRVPGAAARLADHLRDRPPFNGRPVGPLTLRDGRQLRGIHRPGAGRADPAVQWHADRPVDGLRPRDGQHEGAAGQPVAARLPADLPPDGRRHRGTASSLCLPGLRLVMGRAATGLRLSHRAAGGRSGGPDARRARPAALLAGRATRELRGRDELRDFPRVLRLDRALSAVAPGRRQCGAGRGCPAEPLQPRRGAGPLRPVWPARDRSPAHHRLGGRCSHGARGLALRQRPHPAPPACWIMTAQHRPLFCHQVCIVPC